MKVRWVYSEVTCLRCKFLSMDPMHAERGGAMHYCVRHRRRAFPEDAKTCLAFSPGGHTFLVSSTGVVGKNEY